MDPLCARGQLLVPSNQAMTTVILIPFQVETTRGQREPFKSECLNGSNEVAVTRYAWAWQWPSQSTKGLAI